MLLIRTDIVEVAAGIARIKQLYEMEYSCVRSSIKLLNRSGINSTQ